MATSEMGIINSYNFCLYFCVHLVFFFQEIQGNKQTKISVLNTHSEIHLNCISLDKQE